MPEIANDARRNLELLDDLAQLATLVEEIEDAGGDAAATSTGSNNQPRASRTGCSTLPSIFRIGKMLR